MTISDERLDMLLRGAKIDAQMSASAREKREAEEQVVILTELQSLRTTADTEQDGKGVKVRGLEWTFTESYQKWRGWFPGFGEIATVSARDRSVEQIAADKATADNLFRSRILSTLSNAPQQEAEDLRRAANSLLNQIWQTIYTGSKTYEENWQEMERRFPASKWLHEAVRAALNKGGE